MNCAAPIDFSLATTVTDTPLQGGIDTPLRSACAITSRARAGAWLRHICSIVSTAPYGKAVDDDGGLQVKWPQRLCRVAAKQQRERSKQQNRILSFLRFKERGRLAQHCQFNHKDQKI